MSSCNLEETRVYIPVSDSDSVTSFLHPREASRRDLHRTRTSPLIQPKQPSPTQPSCAVGEAATMLCSKHCM